MAAIQQTNTQAGKNWDVYYRNFLSSVNADLTETEAQKKKRIKTLEEDFEAWKIYYFPVYCRKPSARFHKKASKRCFDNAEWTECRIWSREFAKDALMMMETINQAVRGLKKNIILVSNSWDKAAELLEPYRIELARNERLINDYGNQLQVGSWAYGDFTTIYGCSFLAVGADQSPRGTRNEAVRPDKVIISDIDTDQDVLNEDIIDKRFKWYEKALYPTRAIDIPTQYYWLGNLIAKDCCIARARARADYVDVVNIEDNDGNSNWPEKVSKADIERIKGSISTASFMGEYMNSPLTEGKIFKEMIWGKVPAITRFKSVVAYGDPATANKNGSGKTVKKKNKAIILVGELGGIYYIIDAYIDSPTNAEYVDWYYAIRTKIPENVQVLNYIENNTLQDAFYQQVFVPLFFEASKNKGLLGITPDTRQKPDKYDRIEGTLEPLNRTGRLILNEAQKDNPHFKRLEDQFLLVTPGLPYDADGPDATEGAVWIINQRNITVTEESMILGMRKHNNKHY